MKFVDKMLLLPLFWSLPALAEPSVDEILRKADDLYRQDHSIMEMEMYVKTARYERQMKMRATSLGTEKTLIVILEPAKDAGMCTLKVDDKIWNYLPKVDRKMKVPSGMMGGSWMGSHVSNDDLVRENRFSEDFDTKFLAKPGDSNNTDDLYIIEMIPKEDVAIVWGKIVSKSRSDLIPVEVNYYDEDGTLMRIDRFEDVEEIDGITMPTKYSILPQDKPGEMTTMKYTSIDFTSDVSERMFSIQSCK